MEHQAQQEARERVIELGHFGAREDDEPRLRSVTPTPPAGPTWPSDDRHTQFGNRPDWDRPTEERPRVRSLRAQITMLNGLPAPRQDRSGL